MKAFRNDPPKYLSVSFMRRVLAHDLQCRKLGGHSAATKRTLKLVLARRGGSVSSQTAIDGPTLVREWNGRIYRVDVSPEGYALDGKSYGSVSAVARHITGAHWSGPRFFGLSEKRRA
ncbi:DUF2924 domain-containing protein [uncultured Roseovarius sp.]|uniref:DUF2924 domain-containing protein n=1 Tax=uncultured Roseovarius sp. TaxID=293344 RepID=UPI00345C5EFC